MNAEAKLALMERHVHAAEMTTSEGRFKLAKNGFCDRHPDIQLRKRNFLRKETILLNSCPRCDKEHAIQIEQMKSQLEIYKQRMGCWDNTTSHMDIGIPLSVQPWPSSPQAPSQRIEHPPLSSHTNSPTTARHQANHTHRYSMMMASHGHGRTSSAPSSRPGHHQSCSAFDMAYTSSLPARRSSSCRTNLCDIPESPPHRWGDRDDFGGEAWGYPGTNDSERSLAWGVDLELPLTPSRRTEDTCTSSRQMRDIEAPRLIPRTSSSGDLPTDEEWNHDW